MSDAEDEWIPSDAASEQLEDEEEEEEEGEDEEVDIEIQEEEPDDEEEDLIDDTPLEEIDYDNVAVVYLDRPIKNKSRRHEYEPFVNSVIHNISPAAMISCSVEPTPFERSSQDTTEQEQFAMASIFEGSPQFESEYLNVRNYLISRYNSNPFVYLSVPDCHVALGKPDFACLVATHQLLEYLGLINHIPHLETNSAAKTLSHVGLLNPTKKEIPKDTHQIFAPELSPPISIYEKKPTCAACDTTLSNSWYTLEYSNLFKICISCFLQGRYPLHASSKLFRLCFTTDFTTDPWSPEEISALLDGVAQYPGDWNQVSAVVQTKSSTDCLIYFLGHNMRPKQDIAFIEAFLLKSDNPLKLLIDLVSNVLDISAGARVAKFCMAELFKDPNARAAETFQKAELDLTKRALKQLTEIIKPLLNSRKILWKKSVYRLVEFQQKRIKAKLDLIDQLNNPSSLFKDFEKNQLARLWAFTSQAQ